MGRILIGIKKGLEGKEEPIEKEKLMLKKVNWKDKNWKIGMVYIKDNMEKILKKM